jgi:hypothetical protein
VSLPAIRDRALEIALTQIGVREIGGTNRGPQVEAYLAAVGLGPGQPWCCAFVIWCYAGAVKQVGGGRGLPLRRTGKCARLWSTSPEAWRSVEPTVGAVFIRLERPDDPNSDGHTGIVTAWDADHISAVEGNTNASGSRIGDRVRLNIRRRDYVLGYVDIGREGPVDVPVIS